MRSDQQAFLHKKALPVEILLQRDGDQLAIERVRQPLGYSWPQPGKNVFDEDWVV